MNQQQHPFDILPDDYLVCNVAPFIRPDLLIQMSTINQRFYNICHSVSSTSYKRLKSISGKHDSMSKHEIKTFNQLLLYWHIFFEWVNYKIPIQQFLVNMNETKAPSFINYMSYLFDNAHKSLNNLFSGNDNNSSNTNDNDDNNASIDFNYPGFLFFNSQWIYEYINTVWFLNGIETIIQSDHLKQRLDMLYHIIFPMNGFGTQKNKRNNNHISFELHLLVIQANYVESENMLNQELVEYEMQRQETNNKNPCKQHCDNLINNFAQKIEQIYPFFETLSFEGSLCEFDSAMIYSAILKRVGRVVLVLSNEARLCTNSYVYKEQHAFYKLLENVRHVRNLFLNYKLTNRPYSTYDQYFRQLISSSSSTRFDDFFVKPTFAAQVTMFGKYIGFRRIIGNFLFNTRKMDLHFFTPSIYARLENVECLCLHSLHVDYNNVAFLGLIGLVDPEINVPLENIDCIQKPFLRELTFHNIPIIFINKLLQSTPFLESLTIQNLCIGDTVHNLIDVSVNSSRLHTIDLRFVDPYIILHFADNIYLRKLIINELSNLHTVCHIISKVKYIGMVLLEYSRKTEKNGDDNNDDHDDHDKNKNLKNVLESLQYKFGALEYDEYYLTLE